VLTAGFGDWRAGAKRGRRAGRLRCAGSAPPDLGWTRRRPCGRPDWNRFNRSLLNGYFIARAIRIVLEGRRSPERRGVAFRLLVGKRLARNRIDRKRQLDVGEVGWELTLVPARVETKRLEDAQQSQSLFEPDLGQPHLVQREC